MISAVKAISRATIRLSSGMRSVKMALQNGLLALE